MPSALVAVTATSTATEGWPWGGVGCYSVLPSASLPPRLSFPPPEAQDLARFAAGPSPSGLGTRSPGRPRSDFSCVLLLPSRPPFSRPVFPPSLSVLSPSRPPLRSSPLSRLTPGSSPALFDLLIATRSPFRGCDPSPNTLFCGLVAFFFRGALPGRSAPRTPQPISVDTF